MTLLIHLALLSKQDDWKTCCLFALSLSFEFYCDQASSSKNANLGDISCCQVNSNHRFFPPNLLPLKDGPTQLGKKIKILEIYVPFVKLLFWVSQPGSELDDCSGLVAVANLAFDAVVGGELSV